MRRKYHGECTGCLEDAFLRPVLFFPGMWVICRINLCLSCRINWRDCQYGTLVTTLAHSSRRSTRESVMTAPREGC